MAKKQLKKEELENANGGFGFGIHLRCESCNSDIYVENCEVREIGSGCDKVTEAKCPQCGHWNEFDA